MSGQSNSYSAAVIKPKYTGAAKKGFIETLKNRVEEYFVCSGKSRKGNAQVHIKTFALLVMFVLSYALLLSKWNATPIGKLSAALVFGATNVLIVFNIAHDAAHNALFKSKRLNRIFSYTFNLVGASSYLWNITHNQIHHTYPNIGDYDTDIQQQAPLIRVSPTVPIRWYHSYQQFYAPILYLTHSIFLVFLKDFQDIGLLPKKDSKLLENRKHPKKEYVVFGFSKLFYYSLTIVIPLLVLDLTWKQFLIGFLIVHIFMSILLSVVLIPVHMVDESSFNQVSVNGAIEDNWYTHVFRNTVDYSRKSSWANFFFGGLNTHLVHHLFPGVCHAHYIELSDVLKSTAREFGLEYKDVTMGEAIASHFRLLKRMGRKPSPMTL